MKTCTKCEKSKTVEEFCVNRAAKDGRNYSCKECETRIREEKREYYQKWKKDNKESVKEYQKDYRVNNKEKMSDYIKEYYKENKDKIASQVSEYQKNNKAKRNAWHAKRRAAKLKRTPSWLTQEHLDQILVFYEEAQRLTEETGIKYSVDHILPLQGKTVSGLHVPWNLQVMTLSDNCSKRHFIFND